MHLIQAHITPLSDCKKTESCYRPTSRPNHEAHGLQHQGTQSLSNIQSHTSLQRQFKTGVPQGGVLSLTLFNNYTSDLPPPRARVQVMTYTDDMTITSAHTSMSEVNKYIEPYLHKVFSLTKHNNLALNPDKTTYTLFCPDPAEYTSNLDLK